MNNNYIKVVIEGKNVNNYVKWMIKQRINIINLNIIKHNKLEVIIDYKDYKKLKKYSKTYIQKVKINILATSNFFSFFTFFSLNSIPKI